ncbi:MAG: N-acetyltransferase family protein [Spirochaetales bacterium]
MKDVSIHVLTAEDADAAARFIALVNTGEATALPDLPTTKDEARAVIERVLAVGVPAFILRLYEGEGRICGFIAVSPENTSVLLGPLLHIGDWAGHAEAMLRAVLDAVHLRESRFLNKSETLSVRFYSANRNMRALIERHGGPVIDLTSAQQTSDAGSGLARSVRVQLGTIPLDSPRDR